MVNLTIDKIAVSVPEGTTILEAAASVGIEIPSLCYLKDINEISACRVCCVEVEGEGKLVPSCNNVVQEGMVIHTNTPRVREARRTNVELILSQHDNKCATCVRSGSCQLQKISNDLGVLSVPYKSDLAVGKKSFWTTTFPLYRDINKCIKCMRCIQVCDKVQSLSIWDVSGSGSRTTIDVSGNRFIKEADCSLCGQCITHCPTGALRERDDTAKAYSALGAEGRVTVVQIAPAVRAAWGEAFGMPTGRATVGQLDQNALFYMRSRGIPEPEARMLLMFAFTNDVIELVRLDALKDRLRQLVEKRFRGELAKCSGCQACH